MLSISIDSKLRETLNEYHTSALVMDIEIFDNTALDDEISRLEKDYNIAYNIEDVVQLPKIKKARDGYKKLRKDPSRYRLAVESLIRRVVKGNSLYRINNVVDAGNVLSLQTQKSIAVLDFDKIDGDVVIRIGTEADEYHGIGRGKLNVSNIPLYCDSIGPFGSPTSDTERTMITKNTTKILLLIISFDGKNDELYDKQLAIRVFEEFCNAKNIFELKVTG